MSWQERILTYLAAAKGLQLNLPNDLFNGFRRCLVTEAGEIVLDAPAQVDELIALQGSWVEVEGRVGVVALYGDAPLAVSRSAAPRGGKYGSLHVDEICLGCIVGTRDVDPGTTVLDVGWAVLSDSELDQTRGMAEHCERIELPGLMRGVRLRGLDGTWYAVAANFGPGQETLPAARLLGGAILAYGGRVGGRDLVSEEPLGDKVDVCLSAGQVRIWALEVKNG